MSKTFKILGFVVVIGVALGGIAYATIPDTGGVIHGCSQKFTGLLRVVDDPSECRRFEKALDWNVQGPQGPPGEKGEVGETGPGQGIGRVYERFVATPHTIGPLNSLTVSVECDEGDVALSGAFQQSNVGSHDIVVTDSFPDEPSGWVTVARNTNATEPQQWVPGVWCAQLTQ